MLEENLRYYFGIAGVSIAERAEAIRWGRYFEWPMVILALWIPVQWYFESKGFVPPFLVSFLNWSVWLVFVVETSLMTMLVREKWRYLRSNWMNIVVITLGFPPIWVVVPWAVSLRLLRLIVLAGVMFRMTRMVRIVLKKNRLGTTLLSAGLVVIISGVFVAALDPGIKDPVDGIWWALVTITTVGYGDVVPTSIGGRIFGGILIIIGIGLFALLTANFSAVLIGEEVSEMEKEEGRVLKKLEEIDQRLARLEKVLKPLDKGR
ncbi:MAG: ion transporter [Gammaproteobacteria bacterium]|nr:MAG: ion transporter [Gammaproteobacteria bacterium]RLA22733.1 MAG: ion transporter [Gammaproteobacteria bacterium]